MKYLEKFAQLSVRDWRLLAQAFVTLAVCQTRLRRQKFETLRAWAANERQGTAPVNRLTWSIEVAAKSMKGATCLCKALALQRLLARNGYDSELRIGVNKLGEKFVAHAWLVYQGQVLIGGSELENYKLLATWATKNAAAHGLCNGLSER